MTAFYEWCRKMHIDLGDEARTAEAYEKVAQEC